MNYCRSEIQTLVVPAANNPTYELKSCWKDRSDRAAFHEQTSSSKGYVSTLSTRYTVSALKNFHCNINFSNFAF